MRSSKLVNNLITLSSLIGIVFLLGGCSTEEERIDAIARKAENALFENDQEKALSILSKGIKKHKESSPLFEAYSDALAESGKWQEAAEAMGSAIELDPLRKSLLVKLGEYQEQSGQISSAIETLNAYVEFDPKDFLAWKKIYQLKTSSNDYGGAIDAALRWNRLRPSARPGLALGDLFLASGNSAQARSWYAQSAAYVDETHAEIALTRLITLETNNQQYLQADTRIKEFESRYGPNTSNQELTKAKELITRWRTAQEEMARAGQELLAQRVNLEKNPQGEPTRTKPTTPTDNTSPPSVEETPEPESPTKPIADTTNAGTTIAPTPLFDTPSSTETTPTQNTDNGDVSETAPAAPPPSIELSSIDALWNHLGETQNDAEAWLQLAKLYADEENWFEAEPCVLQAKALRPASVQIAAEYLSIIAHTLPQRQVISEIDAHLRLFQQSPAILLARANTFRTLNLNPNTVQQAYRDVLNAASLDSFEYQSATQYLNTGN